MEDNILTAEKENIAESGSVQTPLNGLSKRDLISKYETTLNENAELKEEVSDLKIRIANLEKALYGQRSEKTEVIMDNGEQLSIFNEAEEAAQTTVKEETVAVSGHSRKKRSREEILKDLPVEEVVHTVEDKMCPECGAEMESVGKEFQRDELVYVPAKMFIRKHYTETLKCPECGNESNDEASSEDIAKEVFKKAECPGAMLPGSYCSPELLAHIIFEKYAQAVPLYRQEKEYLALGANLSRTTMANWIIAAAVRYAKPVYNAMKNELMQGKVIHADETVVQVLHEKDRKAKTQSRMWVYASPKASGKYNVLFDYCQTRNGMNAAAFLGDYKGYIVCDGYDGYNKLPNVKRCGCWAHARRKFVEAMPAKDAGLSESRAAQGVEWTNKIFLLEREYENLSAEEIYKQRQERLKPILDGFFAWVNEINPESDKLRRAKQYVLNERKYLCRCLDEADVPVSNNRAENAIRPFVVGRKNWLFSTSERGAEASAMFYSLAVTAYANGLNVEKYFKDLFSSGVPVMPWNESSSSDNSSKE